MTDLVVIDPGISTGIVTGSYTDDTPFEVTGKYQVTGGLMGLRDFLYTSGVVTWELPQFVADQDDFFSLAFPPIQTVVVEKFTPRARDDGGGLTLKSVEPLRIEGYLVGEDYLPDFVEGAANPQWRQPGEQYFSGGTDLASRKKASQEWMKERGLWTTGKEVGQPDADDVNSAMRHALGYMRDIMHLPTLKEYFK